MGAFLVRALFWICAFAGMMKKHKIALFFFCIIFCSACEKRPKLSYIEGYAQGTTYHITLQKPDTLTLGAISKAINQVISQIDAEMSLYRPDSEIMRINQAELHQPIQISDHMHDILTQSHFLHKQSSGYFDVTVGKIVAAYGFGGQGRQQESIDLPGPRESLQLKESINAESLVLGTQQKTLLKTYPVSIDLDAIAQGYTVDQLVQTLESMGVVIYLVELGGELRGSEYKIKEAHFTQHWSIGIEMPPDIKGDAKKIMISNSAVATSGHYRQRRKQGEKEWSHIINPLTAEPADMQTVSVTVVHRLASMADGWATALMAAPFVESQKIAEKNQLAAYWIIQRKQGDFEFFYTDRFLLFVK